MPPDLATGSIGQPMIDWNDIESVFLDLDGTLLDLRFDNHFWVEFIPEHYAQHHQLAPEKARADVLARMKELRGTLDWYCTDFWSRELNLDIIALKAAKRHLIRTRPGAQAFLATLHSGAAHNQFIKAYVGKTAKQFTNYWRKMLFSGKGRMPKAFHSQEELASFVANQKGALGYTSEGLLFNGTKVLVIE